MKTPRSDDIVFDQLKELNQNLSQFFGSDIMIVKSLMSPGLDTEIRKEIEEMRSAEGSLPRLTVILETSGGYIEVVERIYNVMRAHYEQVNFIVPDFAYSAGTVLVLSGDEIYMDYYSVLGPIDPQMQSGNDRFVSGLGYLAKYNELMKEINQAPSSDSVRAQLAFLLKKFDPAELFDLEQAKSHSVELLETWLSKHKFRAWTETEGEKKPVTEQMRKDRAKRIAEILGDPKRWHSHGRGIGLKELTSDEIKLKIHDFGADAELNAKIRNYYGLFSDYCRKMGLGTFNAAVLHTPTRGFRSIG